VPLSRNLGALTSWNPLGLSSLVTGLLYFYLYLLGGGCILSCWGNRRKGDHWGDLGVDGWIILGWISRRWDVGVWTGLGWPRIERVDGRL